MALFFPVFIVGWGSWREDDPVDGDVVHIWGNIHGQIFLWASSEEPVDLRGGGKLSLSCAMARQARYQVNSVLMALISDFLWVLQIPAIAPVIAKKSQQ